VSVLAVDESLLAYQPGKARKTQADNAGQPIPVQNIPRKPHPNGLLVYQATTWIENLAKDAKNGKLPFILDFHPHLQVADAAPHSVIIQFLKNWKLVCKPHVVADSAFGSFDVMKQIVELGFSATLSMPATASDWLWDVLSHNLPSDHWRAAVKDNIVASVQYRKDEKTGKSSFKQILSSGVDFQLSRMYSQKGSDNNNNNTPPTVSSELPFIKRYTEEELFAMTNPELEKLCKVNKFRKLGTSDHNNVNL
jgi:hypothetical protein